MLDTFWATFGNISVHFLFQHIVALPLIECFVFNFCRLLPWQYSLRLDWDNLIDRDRGLHNLHHWHYFHHRNYHQRHHHQQHHPQ